VEEKKYPVTGKKRGVVFKTPYSPQNEILAAVTI
jgi:hypothetical protein